MIIRKYEVRDREAVRWLCCETGFLGNPIDPVFEDRELFADFLTNYYLKHEPESAYVIEKDGEVRGYLLGSMRRRGVRAMLAPVLLALRLVWRFFGYNRESKRFVWWMLFNAWREVPPAPHGTAHFHINLLADVRNVAATRELIDSFLRHLRANGAKAVYGQMVTFSERRGERMFERYGFRVLNRSEITKYRRFHPGKVFLCTVLKDLTVGVQLYDRAE